MRYTHYISYENPGMLTSAATLFINTTTRTDHYHISSDEVSEQHMHTLV